MANRRERKERKEKRTVDGAGGKKETASRPEKSASGLAHSKTLARKAAAFVGAKRLGVRRPSAAFAQPSRIAMAWLCKPVAITRVKAGRKKNSSLRSLRLIAVN
jgi:hypothetical protein